MPTNNSRVSIELYVDDKGTQRVREFADKTNKSLDDVGNKSNTVTEKMQAGWGKMQTMWLGVIAGIVAVREAWGLMNTAAQAQQEKIAFESLAQSYGSNSQKIIAALKEASNGTVDTMTMIRKAGTAMMTGIAPDDVTRLMKVAAATAKMTGQTVTKAFEDIALGSARQSKMILDNLGIMISIEDANKNYAAQMNIVGRELTDAESKQAFLNEAFKQGGDLMDKLGNQTNTQADKFQRMAATTEDLKVLVGDGLVRAWQLLIGVMFTVESGIMAIVEGVSRVGGAAAKVTDFLRITSGAADSWKINAQAAGEAGVDFAGKATQAFKDATSSNEAAIAAQAKHKKIIEDTTGAIEKQAEAERKLTDQQKKVVDDAKKAADEQARVTAEMYKEAGFGADKYFEMESTKLVEKAAKWQKAGADQLQVEDWLYTELAKLSEEAWQKGETAAGQYLDSVQTQTGTLVEEFNTLQQTVEERTGAIAGAANALNGTDIGLSVSFDGSAAYQGIDALIARLGSLQAAAVAAPSGGEQAAPGYNPNETTAEFAERTDNSGTSIVNHFNQQLNRSDITAIVAEQARREARS